MNRKRAIIILAIIEIITGVPLIVLQDMGKISSLTFILALFTILFLSLAAIVFLLYKYPATTTEKKEKEGFDPDSVVSRTREGTIFEVVTGFLIVAAWVIALATRFFIDDNGEVLYRYIIDLFALTSAAVFCLIDVYTPGDFYIARKLANAKQVGLAVRMYRVLAVLVALYLVFWVTPALHSSISAIVLPVVALVTYIVFRILINKAK